MKRLLLITFLATAITGFAQDWQIINPTYKYNYQHDTASYISHIIQVDSVHYNGTDSVYALNRIVAHCDTCTDTTLWIQNQPQFLMCEFVKNDSEYIFRDTLTYVFKHNSQLSDSWLFDSLNGITASISQVDTQFIFGNTDSVKTILLSNGRTILQSKSYGIIQFPDFNSSDNYNLVGVEDSALVYGEKLIGFWEIFDFNVGDIFHTYESWNSPFGGIDPFDIYQYIITSKTVNQIGYLYGITYYHSDLNGVTGPTTGTRTYNFNDWKNRTEKTPNQKDSIPGTYNVHLNNKHLQTFVDFHINQNSLKTIKFGDIPSIWWGNYYPNRIFYDSSNFLIPEPQNALMDYEEQYSESLGLVTKFYGWFEGGSEFYLRGYIKNGDTTGFINPNWILTKTDESIKQSFNLYPNPFTNYFVIEIPKGIEKNVKVEVKDILGKTVYSKNHQQTQPDIMIDASELTKGIYFVELISENENIRFEPQKIVKL